MGREGRRARKGEREQERGRVERQGQKEEKVIHTYFNNMKKPVIIHFSHHEQIGSRKKCLLSPRLQLFNLFIFLFPSRSCQISVVKRLDNIQLRSSPSTIYTQQAAVLEKKLMENTSLNFRNEINPHGKKPPLKNLHGNKHPLKKPPRK